MSCLFLHYVQQYINPKHVFLNIKCNIQRSVCVAELSLCVWLSRICVCGWDRFVFWLRAPLNAICVRGRVVADASNYVSRRIHPHSPKQTPSTGIVMYGHTWVLMVSIEIVSPPTPKPAFVLEVSYFWVLGVSSGCWKWVETGCWKRGGNQQQALETD